MVKSISAQAWGLSKPFRRAFLGSLILAGVSFGVALPRCVLAGTDTTATNPQRRIFDPLGIDISAAQYVHSNTHLTIGDPSKGGLAWKYVIGGGAYYGSIVNSGAATPMTVKLEGNPTQFVPGSSGWVNASGTGSTLVQTATNWVYTGDDGSIYTFNVLSTSGFLAPWAVGQLQTIQQPDGTLITINYVSGTSLIQSVVSNEGYALRYDYSSGGVLSKVSGVNLSAHSCDATILCDAYDNYITIGSTVPSDYSFPVDVVTDALGNSWQYGVDYAFDYVNPHTYVETEGPLSLLYYTSPGGYEAQVAYDGAGRITTFTDTRGVFNFNYNGQTLTSAHAYITRNLTVTDPSGATVYNANFMYGQSIVSAFKDGLSNQTSYNIATYSVTGGVTYGTYTRVLSVTKPEGNYVSYAYNSRGNVTSVTTTPKSGSGLSTITVSAGYDTTCANLKTCNQPNWTQDALGHETDYTYDPTHGGVLTVTLPADQNGLRLRTYTTYETYNTGNGNIYRPIRSETCGLNSGQLGLTACPASTTTAVTTTSYVGKTFLPYQVTQTDGANSQSVTTTMTYDTVGNLIAVDGPRTDVDDITYKTYDADRRIVYEIGPIPASGLYRHVVHHVYTGAFETQTEQGYASGNVTNGTDFVRTSFARMTFDASGRVVKTEAVIP